MSLKLKMLMVIKLTNNANGIKTLSANGLSTFPVRGKPVFGMALKVYLKATWLSFFM